MSGLTVAYPELKIPALYISILLTLLCIFKYTVALSR